MAIGSCTWLLENHVTEAQTGNRGVGLLKL